MRGKSEIDMVEVNSNANPNSTINQMLGLALSWLDFELGPSGLALGQKGLLDTNMLVSAMQNTGIEVLALSNLPTKAICILVEYRFRNRAHFYFSRGNISRLEYLQNS